METAPTTAETELPFLLAGQHRPRGWRLDIAEDGPGEVVFRVPHHYTWMVFVVLAVFVVGAGFVLAQNYPREYRLIVRSALGLGGGLVLLGVWAALWRTRVVVRRTAKLMVIPLECYSTTVMQTLDRGMSTPSRRPWSRGLALVAFHPPFLDVLCYVKNAADLRQQIGECAARGLKVDTGDKRTVITGSLSPWL